jgi:predicted alpha/beta hydrolase family esterase
MSKRVFIIHGWGGYPDQGWLSDLKLKLQKKGFLVYSPAMPDTHEPDIKKWTAHLGNLANQPEITDCFVGYSLGSQAIMRYLETVPENKKVGKVIFIAGFLRLMNLDKEEEKFLSAWLKEPIDLDKVKKHCDKFTAIFSNNDPIVPLSDKDELEEKLGAKIIIENRMGHFDDIADTSFIVNEIMQ